MSQSLDAVDVVAGAVRVENVVGAGLEAVEEVVPEEAQVGMVGHGPTLPARQAGRPFARAHSPEPIHPSLFAGAYSPE